MTPTDKRQSGNPAKQAEIDLTVKQRRELEKQAKLAEYQKQLTRRRRSNILWWTVGILAAIVVVALVWASFAFAPQPDPVAEYDEGSEGAAVEGVETFSNRTDHVEGTVDYEQNPPAGGPHNAIWLNCGVYSEPVPNENAVHSLEHGAVWVTYDPALTDDDLDTLREWLPSSYAILSPYEGMDTSVAVTAWNTQLKVDSVSDDRIGDFFEEYWRSQNAPEPGAACTGGIDAPGLEP